MSTPEPADSRDAQPERSRMARLVLIGLSVACAILLASTTVLATTTFRLWGERTPALAEPTPTPTPAGDVAAQTLQGIEITAQSGVSLDDWGMTAIGDSRHTMLYATLTSDSSEQAVDVSFDATAYTEDGRIIDRAPTAAYLLPGQTSMFHAIFSEDLSDAARIVVEQTRIEREAPAITGELVTESITLDDIGQLVGAFTSTLNPTPAYSDFYLVAYVDGEMYAVCEGVADIPADGRFETGCFAEHVGKEAERGEVEEMPADAEFEAYLTLTAP